MLKDELAALAELRAHREMVQKEMSRLKTELAEEKRARQHEVAELERRNVADKEKLKKVQVLASAGRLLRCCGHDVCVSVSAFVCLCLCLCPCPCLCVRAYTAQEMFTKIKETKRSILAATGDQLHHTTLRTMAENEQITTELTYQSKETEKVRVVYVTTLQCLYLCLSIPGRVPLHATRSPHPKGRGDEQETD